MGLCFTAEDTGAFAHLREVSIEYSILQTKGFDKSLRRLIFYDDFLHRPVIYVFFHNLSHRLQEISRRNRLNVYS